MKQSIVDKAVELYELGYSSSQSVCAALAGHYGLDQETAMKMSASFGDGTSHLNGTCGAVDALVVMAGFEKGQGLLDTEDIREENYKMVRDLVGQFKKRNGSVYCYQLCEGIKCREKCVKYIQSAAEIYTDYIGLK